MTRLVEISAEAVGAVRADVAAVRDGVDARWVALRGRAAALGVPTSGFDAVLEVRHRLDTAVLPVVDAHLGRARELENLRFGGLGGVIPVVDDEIPPAPVSPFTQAALPDGSTALSWSVATDAEVEADRQQTEGSRGIGGWFSDRWEDVSGAVSDAGGWIADTAVDAWDAAGGTVQSVADWWDGVTADLGGWIDQNLDGVRDLIGRHVAVFRFLADACRVVGWIVIGLGAVLTVALAVVGGLSGFAAGSLLGGVGGVPAGVAGVLAGASFGLRVLGVGVAIYSVGDFLDVVADWGEGTVDGQELVRRGSLELGIALLSALGPGVLIKLVQKGVEHLPITWRNRLLRQLYGDITLPSRQPDPGAVPGGRPTRIGPKNDDATRRSLLRENDAAQTLAQKGYVVEQNPVVPGKKNPDYRIEGRVFDALAPVTDNPRNIRSTIHGKVSKGQADRMVVHLDDTVVTPGQVAAALRAEPVEGLQEILVVRNGEVVQLHF